MSGVEGAVWEACVERALLVSQFGATARSLAPSTTYDTSVLFRASMRANRYRSTVPARVKAARAWQRRPYVDMRDDLCRYSLGEEAGSGGSVDGARIAAVHAHIGAGHVAAAVAGD
jgi:hypothetical protein